MESILTSIKKLLGIAEEYKQFDTDIIIHINSALMTLKQLGAGPKEGFIITSEMQTWEQFLGYSNNADPMMAYSDTYTNSVYLEAVKTYIYIKVRLVFDPPSNASLFEALKRQADELEWRINTEVETITQEEGEE